MVLRQLLIRGGKEAYVKFTKMGLNRTENGGKHRSKESDEGKDLISKSLRIMQGIV